MKTKQLRPIRLAPPEGGVIVAESRHGAAFRMAPEAHPFHEIYFVYRGGILFSQGPAWHAVEAGTGSVAPIAPGIVHRMEDTSQSVLLLLGLSPGYMRHPDRQALWCQLSSRPVIHPNPAVWHESVMGLRRVLAEQGRPELGHGLKIAAEVDRILVALSRAGTPGRSPRDSHARVRQVAAQVQQEYYEAWDLDSAAAMAALSRRRFSALFREVTGQTFTQYLNAARVQHAGHLLREGRHSVTGVAFACGINDLGHFYRLFKAVYGVSPGAWVRGEAGLD